MWAGGRGEEPSFLVLSCDDSRPLLDDDMFWPNSCMRVVSCRLAPLTKVEEIGLHPIRLLRTGLTITLMHLILHLYWQLKANPLVSADLPRSVHLSLALGNNRINVPCCTTMCMLLAGPEGDCGDRSPERCEKSNKPKK